MRIFVLGAGASGSLLAQLLQRQGHIVWCGDRDVERARRFLGKKSSIEVREVNARNLRAIVQAAQGCHLLINASPAIFNEIILRAALWLKVHYLDLNSRLTRNPFRPEQFYYQKRFEAKNRLALINAGAAPGLTNLLAKRGAELLTSTESVHFRLYESTESKDPVSSWSAEVAFDAATSRPRVYRDGHFTLARRFAERERFRFPAPIGEIPVYMFAQDEVVTVPRYIPLQEAEAKIGGRDIELVRRWSRKGQLSKSRGMARMKFPATPTPRKVARLIRGGQLENVRFAIAVLVDGLRAEEHTQVRWDVSFPSLYQLRLRGLFCTPISYGTAHAAALFVRHFPRDMSGVIPPEALPADVRRAILKDLRSRDIRASVKIRAVKGKSEDDLHAGE
jgi:saccharopine dehydrogenase (NAD+, L-lysine forming)